MVGLVRRICATLFATVVVAGALSTAPAQAAVTAGDFTFSSLAVERPRDAETVRLSVYIKCPSSLGQWRVRNEVRQWTPEQAPSEQPAASYTTQPNGYSFSCTGSPQQTERMTVYIDPGSAIIRPTSAEVTIRLSNTQGETITRQLTVTKINAQPCCGPKIQPPRYPKLITSTAADAPYGGRNNAVSVQLPYVCWVFSDENFALDLTMSAPRSNGEVAWYSASTRWEPPITLPDPVCNGRWQYPTVTLYQRSGHKLKPGETVDTYGSITTYDTERVTGFRDYYLKVDLRK